MTYPWTAGEVLNAADLNSAIAGAGSIGSVLIWAGTSTSIPTGYIVCDGASLSTTGTYAALFAIVQYRYGGSGASFNLPKLDALYVPFGSILHDANTAGARQSQTVATGNHASTGHTHTLAGHSSTGHAHTFATLTVNNTQSTGHTHTYNAVGQGNHDHYHQYYKPNSSRYLTNTTYVTSGVNHNHTAATTLVTNADSNHQHTGTPSVNATSTDTSHTHTANATTTDTAHSHTQTGSIFVYLIKFA
jgi:hypothetical protein